MTRVLRGLCLEHGKGKALDLEFLLNQIGSIFKPEEEVQEDDSLQAARLAQVRQIQFELGSVLAHDRNGPKKS